MLALLTLLPLAPLASAREPADLEAILQELAIARDVFRSALGHAVGPRLKVTGLEAEYLPKQGVLISMSIVQPWIDVESFKDRSIDLSTEVQTLHDVPELVAEIMTELNMAIAPYDPIVLEELRELREEQKVVRAAQRKLRAQLRDARRAKNRSDDAAAELDEHIADLETELDALVDDYEALNADIDELYASLKEEPADGPAAPGAVEIDVAVAETACNYGDTLKSLGSQEYLTLAVDLQGSRRYYAFRREQLNECRRGNLSAEQLLARAWRYER
jgi:hypothetical protein